MRKHLLFAVTAILFFACKPAPSPEKQVDEEKGRYERMYHRAIQLGDMGVAIFCTHYLLEKDSGNYSYYDTLSMLYYNANDFPQAIMSAQRALVKFPNNPNTTKLLQCVAESAKRLRNDKLALPYFMKLAELTKNPSYEYEVAFTEFYGQDYDNAEKSVNKSLASPATDKYYVTLSAGEGKSEKVPLKAALYNLLGFIREKQNKKAEARECYRKALEIFPEFIKAKQNLASLK